MGSEVFSQASYSLSEAPNAVTERFAQGRTDRYNLSSVIRCYRKPFFGPRWQR
jgi:hypothetical protein